LQPEEIVTDAPVAFREPQSEELEPSTTFPKLSDAGATANCPGVVPVPESAISCTRIMNLMAKVQRSVHAWEC